MLSRTLGPEFGGAIGSLLCFGCIVNAACYTVACTEGLVSSFGPMGSLAQFLDDDPWSKFWYR